MTTTNRSLGYSAVVAAALSLAGCSNWSYSPPMHGNPQSYWFTPDWARAAATGGPAFQQAEVKEYSTLSDELSQAGDWVDSDYFARKSLTTSRSGPTPPETEATWSIAMEVPHQARSTFREQRARLLSVLDGGARASNPALAAHAQARFDCWIERTEEDWQYFFNGPCRGEYEAAMAQLTAAPQPAAAPAQRQFNVYFDFDKSELTPEARQVIAQVITGANSDPSVKVIMLVGKTDTAGTDRYNINLSHRRADTVRTALTAGGIAPERINERWVGYHEPPIGTPLGVREPRNRVVEIIFQ